MKTYRAGKPEARICFTPSTSMSKTTILPLAVCSSMVALEVP
jgi:hypothetical protein